MAAEFGDDRPLELEGRRRPAFVARAIVIAAGSSRPYAEREWRDALVMVESGEVELETVSGHRRRFGPGDIIWFTGLALKALHNCGTDAVVLQAVSRRSPPRTRMADSTGSSDSTGPANRTGPADGASPVDGAGSPDSIGPKDGTSPVDSAGSADGAG